MKKNTHKKNKGATAGCGYIRSRKASTPHPSGYKNIKKGKVTAIPDLDQSRDAQRMTNHDRAGYLHGHLTEDSDNGNRKRGGKRKDGGGKNSMSLTARDEKESSPIDAAELISKSTYK
ncbi:hypothetical protein PoB_006130200 [Plakobranchus ocellatus]|uniref:Uncharacterized protein n=1 Tax=Plakobranchus ocellatus TaxID=259542 RepID=A0AAV4CSC8_9GAST|nr:hypothetical protein PoB_006130200 [Plakobranchus ocellatus]